ncbi:MAG: tripartite tricarboxylate transporter substrate binding protein [Thermodesulfobacteriota bacterium]|nr:tripartite tricarboxylate transporter substrate binding protein [Thermodesulfobacteriota bacterium]
MKRKRILLAIFFTLTFLLFLTSQSLAQKFLTRPIEFVCHAAAGGGSDIMARMIQSIIEKEKITTHTIAVVNRPGGNGAIAFAYVAGKKGDPHYWLTATTSFLTTPLVGQSKFNYKDFIPLTNLAYDDFFVVVRVDSPYKNMKDLAEAAKKKPGELMAGGTYAPGTDAIILYLIARELGAKINYIPFKSGGEVIAALLGGHIDLTTSNPAEALAQAEAKKVRILGITSQKRLEQAPDIPTLKEQGINVDFQQFRSIAAPKDMSEEALKYYEDLFKKLANSKTWKEKYIKENMLTWDYTNSKETYKVWESENTKYEKIMKEMGVIK